MLDRFPATPVLFVVLLLLATAAIVFAWAWRENRRPLAMRIATAAGVGIVAYGAVLVAVSVAADPRALDRGQEKRLCGFYLDCHRILSVAGVQRVRELDVAGGSRRAKGVYYVVALRVRSDAVAAQMRLVRPRAYLVDADGRRYSRDLETERAWAESRRARRALDDVLRPGGSLTVDLVFDVPAAVRDPRLVVRQGGVLERLSELFLIGDEDSLLHPPVAFRL